MHLNQRLAGILSGMLLLMCLSLSVSAKEITASSASVFSFSSADFVNNESTDGIYFTAVPRRSIAALRLGDRILYPGDALPSNSLNELTLDVHCNSAENTSLSYFTISNGKLSDIQSMELSILPEKNMPPDAKSAQFETYQNIPNEGNLQASDPDGDAVTFRLIRPPKRGTAELSENGTFLYTPEKNKTGKDSFTFVAIDDKGNKSGEATISIKIKKPSEKTFYADMVNDPDAFYAMWMKDRGLFSGTQIGDHLCFGPDSNVTRGEFLVMLMELVQAEAKSTSLSSGFDDEGNTPAWMRPYISAAYGNGMISGIQTESQLTFRPEAYLTGAEAAVIIQNTIHFPVSSERKVSSFPQLNSPAWASQAVNALTCAGITTGFDIGDELVTRRSLAHLLYQIDHRIEEDELDFYWIQ